MAQPLSELMTFNLDNPDFNWPAGANHHPNKCAPEVDRAQDGPIPIPYEAETITSLVKDMVEHLSSALNLDDMLTRMLEGTVDVLAAEAGFLFLTEPTTGALDFQIAVERKEVGIRPFRIPKGCGIAGQVAMTGKPIRIRGGEGRLDIGAYNALCVPLVWQGQVIGVLEMLNKRRGHFTPDDVILLGTVASFAAVAIQNTRLAESVLSERDRVITAEEKARKGLARDLHDGPIQLVAGVVMRLEFCQKLLERDAAFLAQEIPPLKIMAEQAIHQMRTTLFELRPLVLETDGLEAALRTAVGRWRADLDERSTKLSLIIKPRQAGKGLARQESKIEAAIFAVVQEGINNAGKHARASEVVLYLRETSTGLHVIIADNGRGFDANQVQSHYAHRASLGLVNIRERTELIGGELTIESEPGRGTQIRIYVPALAEERLRRRGTTGRLRLPEQA